MGRVRELLFCHGTASAVGSAHARGCKESDATEETGMDRHDETKNGLSPETKNEEDYA